MMSTDLPMKNRTPGIRKQVIETTLCFLLIGQLMVSGTMGKISGKVTDKVTGEPIVGANIVLKDTRMGASTDVNGDYFILNVPPGNYTMVVSMLGYERILSANVEVTIDHTTSQSFSLRPGTIESEAVLVIAERPIIDKGSTASEQIVSSKVLEQSGVRTIKDVLQRQAGFFNDNTALAWQRGITKSFIRGASAVQAVYMVDNLSVNSGMVSDNYSGFNTSTIEQVSVQTGGYNAEYGEGRSAIINIISKEATS